MPRQNDDSLLRAVVIATASAGLLALLATLVASPPTIGQLSLGLLLTAGTVPLMYFPYRLRPEQAAELDEIVLCVGLFLVPAGVVILALALGYLISAQLRRWPSIKVLFNLGVKMVSAATALLLADALGFHAQPPAVQIAIGFAVAAVYFLTAAVLVTGFARLRSKGRWLPNLAETVALAAGSWFLASWFGVTVGLISGVTLWMLLPSTVTAVVVVHSSYRRNHYWQERRRLQRFHSAGQALANARRREQVEEIVAPVARDLLEVQGVRLRAEAPGAGEFGSKLASQGMWLVVPEPALSAFNESDRDTLAVLVNMADNALQRIEVVAELERQSLEDHLTGAGNRRRFERMLGALAASAGERFSLALFDVDLFKDVNDRHGHEAGDRSLVELTSAVRSAFRAEDRLFRLGGDEFVLLLPGVTGAQTASRLRDLQRQLGSLEIRHNGESLPQLAISAGVVEYPAAAAGTRELLRAADRALYQAKEGGRNSIVVAGAVDEAGIIEEEAGQPS